MSDPVGQGFFYDILQDEEQQDGDSAEDINLEPEDMHVDDALEDNNQKSCNMTLESFRLLAEEFSDEDDSGSECGEIEECTGPQPLPGEEVLLMELDVMTGELHPASLRPETRAPSASAAAQPAHASPRRDSSLRPESPQPDTRSAGCDLLQEASPARDSYHSPTPPPYSPLSCPRSPSAASEEPGSPRRPILEPEPSDRVMFVVPNPQQPEPARGRGAGRMRGARTRGAHRGGRGRAGTARAVAGDAGWQPGGRVIEVCLTDEDVPPSLRTMVHDLENARLLRTEREMRRRRKVRVNDGSDDSEQDDEYVDAESSIVDELFGGDSSAMTFQWAPMASFEGVREPFKPRRRPGPRYRTSCSYRAFRQFWDDNILKHIVTETNRYAAEVKSTSQRFARDWYDTNTHEILILFAFWMMLGIVKMPSIKSCFSSNPLLKTHIFSKLLVEQRYWLLNRALHFVNNATRTPDSSKLFCLGPIVEHLNKKFSEAYTPAQNIAIDESLTLWKGSLSFRQYIKTKAVRFGIKTFELCESGTGYLWSFIIYTGKDHSSLSKLPKSAEVVVKLMKPLLRQGYTLFMDNWFNSPILARFLKRNRTDCVGTLRKHRKKVPDLIKLATLQEGTCVARHSGDVVVMAYQDKMNVCTLSTCHGTESALVAAKPGRPAMYKPAAIVDYNSAMGAVDKKDQLLEPYLIERKKCQKWYKKMFKRLLNASILNSRIIVDKSSEDEAKQLAFRLDLVDKIMTRHLNLVPVGRQREVSNRNHDLPETRFLGSHYIVRNSEEAELTAGPSRNSKNRRYCKWCLVREKRYSRTVYICDSCQVPLCIVCFKSFHTVH